MTWTYTERPFKKKKKKKRITLNPFSELIVWQASITLFFVDHTEAQTRLTHTHWRACTALLSWQRRPPHRPPPACFHTVYMREQCSFTPLYLKWLWCNYMQWQGYQKLWIQPTVARQKHVQPPEHRNAVMPAMMWMRLWIFRNTSTADRLSLSLPCLRWTSWQTYLNVNLVKLIFYSHYIFCGVYNKCTFYTKVYFTCSVTVLWFYKVRIKFSFQKILFFCRLGQNWSVSDFPGKSRCFQSGQANKTKQNIFMFCLNS